MANALNLQQLTIIRRRRSEYCRIIPEIKYSPVDYSTIFTEPEGNDCFSIITQVIIRATANCSFFHVIRSFDSSETSRNRAAVIWKISASVL